MENYLKWTDDHAGMIRRNDGTVVAKCVHADGAVAEDERYLSITSGQSMFFDLFQYSLAL